MTTMEKQSLEAFEANNLENLHQIDDKLTDDIREKLKAKFPALAADIFDNNNDVSTKIKVEKITQIKTFGFKKIKKWRLGEHIKYMIL